MPTQIALEKLLGYKPTCFPTFAAIMQEIVHRWPHRGMQTNGGCTDCRCAMGSPVCEAWQNLLEAIRTLEREIDPQRPKFKPYDVVVLLKDLPLHGLHNGTVGTVVEVYGPDAFEVEFWNEALRTSAVVTLSASDLEDK